MALFMPIQPEPASRIYANNKWFELRKSSPPKAGFVYLYETRDDTATINAIRGGFFFRQYLKLPLEQLWAKVGEHATSRERFLKYYGSKHKYGVALAIERVEVLSRSIALPELNDIDKTFKLPRWPWTYMPIDDDSRVIRYLSQVPRRTVFERSHSIIDDPRKDNDVRVAPLATEFEADLFVKMFNVHIRPNYPETEDYAAWVVQIHRAGLDPYGYFTRRKTIWTLFDNEPIGFSVVSEKRGGSIKFGPTVILPERRKTGLGTKLRLLIEANYSDARKCYNTLPDNNPSALRYVINAGYHIEAHLQRHYSQSRGELVVGKLMKAKEPPPELEHANQVIGSVDVIDAAELPLSELETIVCNLLSPWYNDIDRGFVEGLFAGMQGEFNLSQKSKRALLAIRKGEPIGIMIVTPKRGGALKCSPLVVHSNDPFCFRKLIEKASNSFVGRDGHKLYIHIPLTACNIVNEALHLGFTPEGVLLEPYKPGIDLLALGRINK